MLRLDCLRAVYPELENCLVVTIMGATAAELHSLGHRPNFFYLQHAMGLASSTGLGLSLSLPDQKVVVFDGDGSLLDHSVYVYGSGIGNSSLHDHENLPILVAGGTAAGLKGGRHIRYQKAANLANLHLTLLDRVGVHLDSFMDSTGEIEDLFIA